eukprot:854242-Amphidinium_carterae.2
MCHGFILKFALAGRSLMIAMQDFWLNYLSDVELVLDLPLDKVSCYRLGMGAVVHVYNLLRSRCRAMSTLPVCVVPANTGLGRCLFLHSWRSYAGAKHTRMFRFEKCLDCFGVSCHDRVS